SSTTDRPEQLGLLVGRAAQEAPVGRDDLSGHEMVDGQAVRAPEQAQPAGGREPSHADVPGVAGADRETVRGQLVRDLRPERPGADAYAPVAQQLHAAERGEVDDGSAVVRRDAADAVTAAAGRERAALF